MEKSEGSRAKIVHSGGGSMTPVDLPLRQKIRRAIRLFPPVAFLLYIACRGLETAAGIPSPRVSRGFARTVGKILYPLDRWMRPLAEAHLRLVGFRGDTRERIESVYAHFVLLVLELFRFARIMRSGTMPRDVVLEAASLRKTLGEGRGVILVAAHHGNWEAGIMAFALAGFPIHSIGQSMKNPWIDRWLNGLRGCTGIKMIPREGSAHSIARALKRKEIVGIMADLNARSHGIPVQFFGHPVSTVRMPALFSLKKDVPIIPALSHRDDRGRIHVVAGEALDPRDYRGDPDALFRMTQDYTTQLERAIRAHPGQWNWFYRRWRNVPTVRPTP